MVAKHLAKASVSGSEADPLKGNLVIDGVLGELSLVVECALNAYDRLILN